MTTPGSNILARAQRLIRTQTLGHRAFVSRSVNGAGEWVSVFAASVDIQGNMQAVNRKLYAALGLQLTKNYSNLYTSAAVKPTTRDREGDLIMWNGKTWQCESDQDWSGVDGWRKMLCVEVPDHE